MKVAERPGHVHAPLPAGGTGSPLNSPIVAANTANMLNVRLVPFTLAPGESAEVLVEMTPGGYGDRQAYLRFDGHQLSRPDQSFAVSSAVHGLGLTGPSFHAFPEGTLVFPYPLTPTSPERTLILDNYGDQEGLRTDIAIVGRDAARFKITSEHDAVRHIASGDAETFHLALSSLCAPLGQVGASSVRPSWMAMLRIGTSEGPITVPLSGHPLDFLQRSQQPRLR